MAGQPPAPTGCVDREEVRASPRPDCPATPHAQARRHRSDGGSKAKLLRDAGNPGAAGCLRDCGRAGGPPRWGDGALSTLVTAARAVGSWRTTRCPTSRSLASATSAHRVGGRRKE
ncbi:hypothetical protein ZWY2020_041248 [Hordeum vulgare]|nr:hypothetical protein ZWY2020_041248 [Hordeum vulgare]